jgi:hypothetical protein
MPIDYLLSPMCERTTTANLLSGSLAGRLLSTVTV